MSEEYWIVNLRVFAFDTKAEADTFRDVLTDAFVKLPEAEQLGASAGVYAASRDDLAQSAELAALQKRADALAEALEKAIEYDWLAVYQECQDALAAYRNGGE